MMNVAWYQNWLTSEKILMPALTASEGCFAICVQHARFSSRKIKNDLMPFLRWGEVFHGL